MAATTKIVEVELDHERDTANTHVFSTEAEDAPIRALYIQKAGLKGPAPKKIKVTVEEA